MISVKDLKIHYGDFVAVDRLTFEVEKGSVYGLIGPNGAGKTTTIKAIASLIEPTYGEISLDGTSVLHEPEKARKMLGYMPDFPPVYDDLRVDEFCDLFAHAYGLNPEERAKKVEECLGLTALLDKRKALCKTLSRGMKQRALLAKTLVHDPPVMLLDEPAANLDPRARIDLRNLLRKLASEGKTILVSSHVLSELQDLCDAIGIMKQGTMIHSGTIDEIAKKTNPSKTIQIDLTDPLDGIESGLNDFSMISSFASINDSMTRFELAHTGTINDEADILASLVNKGAKVCRFQPKQSKVEDLFLQVESGSMEGDKK
jgi:ABC-2 type transport system ATP-binding protein